MDTTADQALLLDYDTGAVLLEKNADKRMYPASMTKMMTVYILFQRLANGALSLEDTFPVSRKAWEKGGSKMFVEVGKQVRVEDLLRGIIVQSGNDASIVVAEGISGNEDAFAEEMTEQAQELGMSNTRFRNASGWPDPGHYTTARDLALLAEATIRNFPEFYHIYSEKEFTYGGIEQQNRNPLIQYDYTGADGLKTGHTQASGYGLTASAARAGRRLILVVNGLDSERARMEEAKRLMTWGFREWNRYRLFEAGQKVAEVPVWLGEEKTVPAVVDGEVNVTLQRKERDSLKVTVRYVEPAPAPITRGDVLGTVLIEAKDMQPVTVPLRAAGDVNELGMFGNLVAAFSYLLWGGR